MLGAAPMIAASGTISLLAKIRDEPIVGLRRRVPGRRHRRIARLCRPSILAKQTLLQKRRRINASGCTAPTRRQVSTLPVSTLPAAIGRGSGEAKPPRRSRGPSPSKRQTVPRDEAAGVSRNSMLARRHRRVARRGRRSFLENELICRNADESMGRVSPPRLARRASPVRFDSRVWRNKPNADGLRTASGILAERNTPENRSQIKVLRAPSRHGWCRAVKPAPGVLHPAGGEPPQAEAGLLGFAPDRIGRDLPCHHEGLTASATSRRGGSAPLAAPSRA